MTTIKERESFGLLPIDPQTASGIQSKAVIKDSENLPETRKNPGLSEESTNILVQIEGTDLNDLVKKVGDLSYKETDSTKYLEMLIEARIDPNKPMSLPPVCLSFIGAEGSEGIIGSLGDFTLIIGKAKSRKTFCAILFLASMVFRGLIQGHLKGTLPKKMQRVIFFDTEQSEFYVQKVFHRVKRLASGISENFDAYCLRKYTPNERLKIIEAAIYNTPDLGFVVIDGVRDLVTSINDEEEATIIASKLLKWTQEKQIHIITVLHQNKGDQNARGHLGTELVNKAQTVLSVSLSPKNNAVSIVEPEFCRNQEPERFAFTINEEGLPELIDNWDFTLEPIGKKKRPSPDQIDSEIHEEVLADIFNETHYPKGPEIKKTLCSKFGIGNNKAGEWMNFYESKGWITRNGEKNAPNSWFKLNPEAFMD